MSRRYAVALTVLALIGLLLGPSPAAAAPLRQTQIPDAEYQALVALYNSTNGPAWANNTGWLDPATPPCSWYGVSCTDGHVTSLALSSNGLVGTIPPELGNLTGLRWLGLNQNQLTGAIPPELGSLANLNYLHLDNNELTGAIPPELGNLANLQGLSLCWNQLTGTIPPELSSLANLRWLYLYRNQLTGAIPPELGNLAELWYLELNNNQLTGAIPPELDSLAKLQVLDLDNNQLTGAIPPELSSLANLGYLELNNNELTGAIPPKLGSLAKLRGLGLSNNQLTGAIPPELSSLANLWYLDLSNNPLTGAILPELGSLANLQSLHLDNNQLTGAIPPELGSLANLQYLVLSNNELTGAIPPELGNLAKLDLLWLSTNQLTGAIPPELGSLANLQFLYLDNNRLTGAIPPELGNLANLQYLYLDNNQLTGAIPPEMSSLANLWGLDLSNNQLTGAIPPELGNLTSLQELWVSSNRLVGSLPGSLMNLTSLSSFRFNDTDLCEPGDATFQEWLAGITDLQRTGVTCPLSPAQVTIFGPGRGMLDKPYTFTATVEPLTTELPITYTWEASGCTPVTHGGVASLKDTVVFSWTVLGTQVITVTAQNALGSVTATHSITTWEGFTNLGGLGLPGISSGSVAWGDYDNDGDLDILLSGNTGSGYITRVYRNDGGTLVIASTLTGVINFSTDWGDYDNDGDLDILLSGCTSSNQYITRVYRNDSGAFIDILAGLPGIDDSSVAWGDYDNDGDLDILLSGYSSSEGYITRIYRNDGNRQFANINAPLQGVHWASAAWGDYDSDGDLDILLSGDSGSGSSPPYITRIYRNDGGTFTDIVAGLPGVWDGSVAWGDYDSDGDLDILLSGNSGSSSSPLYITRIYRNDGDSFADIQAGLPGVGWSVVAWGDYDNDGDLDVLLGGADSSGTRIARVYRNDGGGVFVDVSAGLPGVSVGSAAWGDYDNDGDLDVLLSGYTGSTRITQVYRNEVRTANTPPAAPGGLVAVTNGTTVTLGWAAASDGETPAAGLSYNLRVGTTPGGAEVLSPMADAASGRRRLPSLGNAGQGTDIQLKVTPGNTYYWSVQAVDTAFAGGPFAAEGSFTVPLAPGSVTIAGPTEGTVDVAHIFTATVEPTSATLPVTYVWQATGQEPVTHTSESCVDTATFSWSAPGTQAITVTASNAAGVVTGTHSITLYPVPEASFSAAPATGVAPLTASFTNTSIGDYESSLWDFGDEITSTLASPTHTYALPGVYTVTLTVAGPGGSDTEVKTQCITAYTPVQAAFSAEPTDGVAPLDVAFTNASTGDYTSSEWDFGDGLTSTEASPVHRYATPGVYTVSLMASGPGGSDTEIKAQYITVYTPVEAAFMAAPTAGIAPLTVAFFNTSTGEYTASQWDFGDGTTSELASLTHTYAVGGVYTVSLTVSGPHGTDTETKTGYIAVYVPVQANFTAASGGPLTMVFTNTSTGDYTSSLWDFGDGITSTLQSPTHTYATQGSYIVKLTISGPGGTRSVTQEFKVKRSQ